MAFNLVTRCFTTSGRKENKWSRTCCLQTGKTQNLGSILKEDTRQERQNFGSLNHNFVSYLHVRLTIANMGHCKLGSHSANNKILQSQNS